MQGESLVFEKKIVKYLKVMFVVTWVGVIWVLLWPTVKPTLGSALSNLNFNTRQEVGLVLQPVRPVTDTDYIATTVSYSTSSAENIDGYYLSGSFTTKDLRVLALQQYLKSKGSPMANYADVIVSVSDASGMDYRTFVAISGVESGYGRVGQAARVGHNPIGWRGGPGGKYNVFSSWPESINYLIPRLARNYGTNPSPYDIQSTYCPPCGAVGTNEWANGVSRNLSSIAALYESL